MVKAKASNKPKPKPKSISGFSSNRKACAVGKVNVVAICCACGESIDDDSKAVQCERCVTNETWKCAECLDLTDELYHHFVTSSKANFHWFCEKCEVEVLGLGPCSNKLLLAQLNDIHLKTDSVKQHLVDSLAGIERRLLDSQSDEGSVAEESRQRIAAASGKQTG